MYILTPWILTILQTSMLTVQTRLLHNFWKPTEVSGLVAVFFLASKICGLGLWPYSRTASPVSLYTYYTHPQFHLSGLMAAGFSKYYVAPCQVSQSFTIIDKSMLWCALRLLPSTTLRHVMQCCKLAHSTQKLLWTHWDLNPGLSACEADVIPLHHVPLKKQLAVAHILHIRLAIQTLQMSIMEMCLSCAFRSHGC